MRLVSENIDHYCLNHSSAPSSVADELFRFTQANVPMSVMLSGPMVGSFLGFLISASRAKRALEIGTYTGYSALVMAERLPPNGEVITLDIDATGVEIARQFWAKSPHGQKIKPVLGDALNSLSDLSSTFDFVFIDADKESYIHYLERSLELLSETGIIVADNCLWSGRVADPTNQEISTIAIRNFNEYVHSRSDLQVTLLPVRDGLYLIRKNRI